MRRAVLDDLPGLYRSESVRTIERAAWARFGLDEDALMARAGLAAWRLILERWPQAQRIGIACGPGNNGGDGYALAELARASGRSVGVLRLCETIKTATASRAAEAYLRAGGVAAVFAPGMALPEADVWVDALFGIGLQRAPEGAAAALIEALNARSVPLLALDAPSGVDADSGHDHGLAIRAEDTLSFIAGKPGLFTGRGRAACGEVVVHDLDLPPEIFDGVEPAARRAGADALRRWLPPRARDAHKGHFGSVLCVGGDHGFGGAIALCAEAAHRAGAGLVAAATRAEHVPVILGRRPECMARAVAAPADLPPLLARSSVVAVGPGLGLNAWGEGLFEIARTAGLPMVVDADALNLLAASPEHLERAVLTPHPGEAARLLGITVAEIESNRIASAQLLAEQYQCVVVWKGAGSVVAAPGETAVLIDAGNPGMASGGMGDALTGTIAALLAQEWSCFDAAVCGALLHAAAGDAAAREGGERGMLASDLLAHLRRFCNPQPRS